MKKLFAAALAAAVLLTACGGPASDSTPASQPESSLYTPGEYTGTAVGMGDLSVTVTVDETSITAVSMDLSQETPSIGQAAEEPMIQGILDAQGPDFDAIAGATITVEAVKLALTDALSQASGTVAEKTPVQDGTYTASAASFSVTGMMTCEVTFQDNRITDIQILEESDSQTGMLFATVPEKYIPRLLETQSLSVDAITGATYSSNAVKLCVAQCIDQAGGSSTQWYTPVQKNDDTVVLEGYDVIVVGLGGSGILSYCSAAAEGATVFGIEQSGRVGGNSVHTAGPMAINSEYLKETENNGEDYINGKDVLEVWLDYVDEDADPAVIETAVYRSGEILDYYIENFGIQVSGLVGSFAKPEWTGLWTNYVGETVLERRINANEEYQAALDKAKAMNEKNDYMVELTATDLITDETGTVIGVRAQAYTGTTYEVYGDTVILATGGFVGNEEMMTQYLGSPVSIFGTSVNNGAGIRMAMDVGGALCNIDTLPMIHITQVPNIIRNDDLTADQKAILTALCLSSDQLAVTTDGTLWGNPKPDISCAPGFTYYAVYTQEEIDAIRSEGLRESYATAVAAAPRLGQGGSFETGVPVTDIDTILAVGTEYGNVLQADSVEALAEAIGCDASVLQESLSGLESSRYYAVIATGYAYGTVGGLDVDVNMNVLREDGSPIENLFAVGQDSEGVTNASNKPYTPWGGQAQSWTFVSGRIAGQNAASFAAQQ